MSIELLLCSCLRPLRSCAVFGVHRDGHLVPMFLNVERTDTCFAAVSVKRTTLGAALQQLHFIGPARVCHVTRSPSLSSSVSALGPPSDLFHRSITSVAAAGRSFGLRMRPRRVRHACDCTCVG